MRWEPWLLISILVHEGALKQSNRSKQASASVMRFYKLFISVLYAILSVLVFFYAFMSFSESLTVFWFVSSFAVLFSQKKRKCSTKHYLSFLRWFNFFSSIS